MNESASQRVGGIQVFWKCASFTVLRDLKKYLGDLSLESFSPEVRTPAAALKSALDECYPTRAYRVEPLKARNAFEVISIERGEDRNDYLHKLWVGIDANKQVEVRPFEWEAAQQIVKVFNKHMGLVTAASVTKTLAALVAHLTGTHLPSLGNLYWLPDTRVREWRDIAVAVESAGCQGGSNAVHLTRTIMDEDAVRAVRDGIVQEIQQESERIHAECLSGELGERALTHRQAEADLLRDKISLYESLLSIGLDHLREGLTKAEEAAVVARLRLSAPIQESVPA